MKRSGGFAVVETLIFALVIVIIALGGYYVVKRNHHTANTPSSSVISNLKAVSPPTPAPAIDGTLNIPEFGIQLKNIPDGIKDLTYTYYPANTDSNFTQASFTTISLNQKVKNCSIGTLNRYPGKYSADKFQGPGNFVKQFKNFWVMELDEGVSCRGDKTVQDMQNTQVIAFKQYVTNPDNMQEINQ